MGEFINKTDEEIEVNIEAKQPLTGNSFTVATLPAAADHVGRCVYVSDGSAGAATAAVSDGTNWKVAGVLGATVAAS
jgi:hypothetical protein